MYSRSYIKRKFYTMQKGDKVFSQIFIRFVINPGGIAISYV